MPKPDKDESDSAAEVSFALAVFAFAPDCTGIIPPKVMNFTNVRSSCGTSKPRQHKPYSLDFPSVSQGFVNQNEQGRECQKAKKAKAEQEFSCSLFWLFSPFCYSANSPPGFTA
jgi:hypothetical protein